MKDLTRRLSEPFATRGSGSSGLGCEKASVQKSERSRGTAWDPGDVDARLLI